MTTGTGNTSPREHKPTTSTLDYIRSGIQWIADGIFSRENQETALTTAKVSLFVVATGIIIAGIMRGLREGAPKALEGRVDDLAPLRANLQGHELASAILVPRVMPMPMPQLTPPIMPPQVYIPLPHHPPCDYHLHHPKHKHHHHHKGMV